jgi:hypothetical protein
MAFVSDRRFSAGENLDLHFEDEAGAAIRCRIQVLRAERAVYGRTRYASRILAIGEIDQLRLDRLCNRCRLREECPFGFSCADQSPFPAVKILCYRVPPLDRRSLPALPVLFPSKAQYYDP